VMDGPTTAAAIRANPLLMHIPIVIMSGAPESSLQGRFDGYVAFLRKPFRDSDVRVILDQVMQPKA
jgi:CheY-like chemotaxis protein